MISIKISSVILTGTTTISIYKEHTNVRKIDYFHKMFTSTFIEKYFNPYTVKKLLTPDYDRLILDIHIITISFTVLSTSKILVSIEHLRDNIFCEELTEKQLIDDYGVNLQELVTKELVYNLQDE